ncbi:hypothetical protein FXV83_35075 [Bradyrhizobium hipponense]|uniref:Uncharacterized protein n=1 Tax=Bradyrhizobium hipponense TaxID=2605638 RepID=A0A5S4YDA1_9BRAD|nr:hypothetical protein [Bradyrhizobium hipponense]TYO61998.1 hypothetical protein FXV83_35075 [Bradyrhizobium hipponense]
MAASHAIVSIKALIVICGIAAMPVASLAQGTGSAGSTGSIGSTGSTGSTGGSAGLSGGVANSPAPPPGTNSLGTAQSSGPNAARATTTDGGAGAAADATVSEENRLLEKKMKSICRGC